MTTAEKVQNESVAFLESPRPITCEREFLEALRARREDIQVGYETIEAMCDMPSGYAGKLFMGRKAMGAMTMWLILRTLGYSILLVEDPATLAKMRNHHQWDTVKRKPKTRRWTLREIAIARRRNAPWLLNSEKARELGAKGGKKRAANAARRRELKRTLLELI